MPLCLLGTCASKRTIVRGKTTTAQWRLSRNLLAMKIIAYLYKHAVTVCFAILSYDKGLDGNIPAIRQTQSAWRVFSTLFWLFVTFLGVNNCCSVTDSFSSWRTFILQKKIKPIRKLLVGKTFTNGLTNVKALTSVHALQLCSIFNQDLSTWYCSHEFWRLFPRLRYLQLQSVVTRLLRWTFASSQPKWKSQVSCSKASRIVAPIRVTADFNGYKSSKYGAAPPCLFSLNVGEKVVFSNFKTFRTF